MREFKKSYKGFIIWLIFFCLACCGMSFIPIKSTQLMIAIVDNIMTIGCFILTFIIYVTESVYWYNGTTFEAAMQAGPYRRKRFAFEHMKRFGIFALVFLVYSIISILVGIPYGIDITIATIGIVVTALSTIKIKL